MALYFRSNKIANNKKRDHDNNDRMVNYNLSLIVCLILKRKRRSIVGACVWRFTLPDEATEPLSMCVLK